MNTVQVIGTLAFASVLATQVAAQSDTPDTDDDTLTWGPTLHLSELPESQQMQIENDLANGIENDEVSCPPGYDCE